MVGLAHTGAPEGAQAFVPTEVRPVILGCSGIVCVPQRTVPVAASTAITLPRNVQHSYAGSAAGVTSSEETAT